ncbi:ThiF family adenylyltransferase [Nocardioides zhouii]|uniref:ThiF family adenylyltransferase n=1 Tax=Nocardioides zhouii TaxID=1168729 RepID=A0A4Q2SWN3_9ACTN|nr:ThiF family adenylyltransferase [Nocardioides zhouii]RYC10556.1 ThiF family adenylyltransferase [Nocardioides zhouii]
MSTAPLGPDPDVRRLIDDGHDISLVNGHLVVKRVPYVTTEKGVAYGFLAYPVTVSGDNIVHGSDHRIWFGGSTPCNEDAAPFTFASAEALAISPDLNANLMLSSKPGPEGYASEYEKVTAYVRMLAHPAMALDDTVTATPGAAWQQVEDNVPFRYRDTATTRAGLSVMAQVFWSQRIAIVGLGGTGAYILDQVAKTPVASILIIDGDVFDNHNAFRAPGAPTLEQLRARPPKVDYYYDLYGRMHTGIDTEQTYITDDNLNLLDDATFVFLAMDDATMKPAIAAHLIERHIAFIDIGMGIEEIDSRLSGLLRMVFAGPGADVEDALARIPKPAEERDDYGRNIQVADLNALNAVLAIGRWKRHLGFYADATSEDFATYSMFTNHIANESGTVDDDLEADEPDESGASEGPVDAA